MNDKLESVAATIGRDENVVDMLDSMLTEPADRAYVVCSAEECRNNVKGQCTIHLVKGRRAHPASGRCAENIT